MGCLNMGDVRAGRGMKGLGFEGSDILPFLDS